MNTLDLIYRRRDDVRFRVINSQGVIICQDSGEAVVVALDPVGVEVQRAIVVRIGRRTEIVAHDAAGGPADHLARGQDVEKGPQFEINDGGPENAACAGR